MAGSSFERLKGIMYLLFCVSPLALAGFLTLSDLRLDGSLGLFVGILLLLVGGYISLHNAYATWGGYLLHRLGGGSPSTYRKKIALFPIFGVVYPIGVALIPPSTWSKVLMWVFMAIDMGGAHWFAVSTIARGRFRAVFWDGSSS